MLSMKGRNYVMKVTNPRLDTTIQQTDPHTIIEDQQTEPQPSPAPVLPQKTPQEFYAEITKRADIRVVMEELATG